MRDLDLNEIEAVSGSQTMICESSVQIVCVQQSNNTMICNGVPVLICRPA